MHRVSFFGGRPGTFFVIGHKIAPYNGELIDVKKKGHLIGQSTFSGEPLTATKDLVMDVRKADMLVTPYVVGNMFLFAPVDGFSTEDQMQLLNRAGFREICWACALGRGARCGWPRLRC